MNFGKLTEEMGYRQTDSCHVEEDLRSKLKSLLALKGPNFLEVKVQKGARKDLGRPTKSPKENLKEFMENILD